MKLISRQLSRVTRSATIATWFSQGARLTNTLVVLPFVLTSFTEAEIAVWLLIVTLNSFQILFDGGFTPTLTRFVSYLSADHPDRDRLAELGFDSESTRDIIALRRAVVRAIKWTSFTLSIAGVALLVSVGPVLIARQAAELPSPRVGALALMILAPTWFIEMNGRRFLSILEGSGDVARVRRWAGVFGILTAVTNIVVVLSGAGILLLTFSSQVWRWVNVVWNRHLVHASRNQNVQKWTGQSGRDPSTNDLNKRILKLLWSKGKRSALGVAFGYGSSHATGLIYAQVGSASAVAGYLLALRLFDLMKQISQAPFYSVLPRFGEMYAAKGVGALKKLSQERTRVSLLLFSVSVVTVFVLGDYLLALIGSNANLPAALTWYVLGLAFLMERTGAMNLQTYTVSNHVVWHHLNIAKGLPAVALSLAVARFEEPLYFALTLLAANGFVYMPWATALNGRFINESPVTILRRVTALPAMILGAGLVISLLFFGG